MEHSLFPKEYQGQAVELGNLATAEITLVGLGAVTVLSSQRDGNVPVGKSVDVEDGGVMCSFLAGNHTLQL